MKRASCETCRCPLTLLRVSRTHYEKRKLCARCATKAAAPPKMRLVARAPAVSTKQFTDDWMERVKANLLAVKGKAE